ncbi:MAG: DUF3089 domain-containing protein [Proteobacteria bacterium]|nr:DUF3089 domain-containing protein [Pseudomonadota bacterium]
MKRVIFSLATILLLTSGALATARPVPIAPDYSQPGAWAAYPGRPSHADDTPQGLAAGGAQRVAVFFIHPTTYLAPVIGNASFDEGGEVGARVDATVLKFQASVFNLCCRIFAPRYRQASLRAVIDNSAQGYAADELAYGDVARAFQEFLRLNPGQSFILASHSQGSIHALRLLQEQVIGKPLQTRLVAAYVIGLALPKEIERLGLPVCSKADATGCVITWNSVARGKEDRRRLQDSVIWWQGRYQPIAGRPIVCVNPLDWHPDSGAAATSNPGSVYSEGRSEPIPPPIPRMTGAWCDGGLLGVDVPVNQRRRFRDLLTVVGIYHDFDYGLFYSSIRENARMRVLNDATTSHADVANSRLTTSSDH